MAGENDHVDDMLADARRRQHVLQQQLSQSPLVDVVGVVDADGAAGSKMQGEELWTLRFSFAIWRHPDGTLHMQKLSLQKPVTHEELQQVRDQLAPYAVIQVRIRLAEQTNVEAPRGLLIELVNTNASDQELTHHAKVLQEPVTFEDSVFGVFTLNRRMNWYEATTTWGTTAIQLNLSLDESESEQLVLEHAHALWDQETSWETRISDFAVSELLDLKNDTWLDEDEEEVQATQFKQRMTLESITIYPDQSFEFWHNDGDLFWGHAILVSGNLQDGPTDADIPG